MSREWGSRFRRSWLIWKVNMQPRITYHTIFILHMFSHNAMWKFILQNLNIPSAQLRSVRQIVTNMADSFHPVQIQILTNLNLSNLTSYLVRSTHANLGHRWFMQTNRPKASIPLTEFVSTIYCYACYHVIDTSILCCKTALPWPDRYRNTKSTNATHCYSFRRCIVRPMGHSSKLALLDACLKTEQHEP